MSTVPAHLFEEMLGPDWAKRALQTPYRPNESIYDMLLNREPWPHMVRYQHGRATYVPARPLHVRG